MEHREKGRLSCCHVTCQKSGIPEIPQYRYLHNLKALALDQPIRNAALDYAYAIAPDIIISREAFDDETINQTNQLVDETRASLARRHSEH